MLFAMIVLASALTVVGVSRNAAAFPPPLEEARAHRTDQQLVLSVIERRTGEGKVLDRLREKVGSLNDRDLRLAASLCKRIARDDHHVGAKIAFSIVTAMIALS